MTTLPKFWMALEGRYGSAAVRSHWETTLGSEWPLVRRFLRPNGERADTFPVFDRAEGRTRYYRVVEHAPNDLVGLDDDGERMVLERDDLVVYALDLHPVCLELVRLLGLRVDPDGSSHLPKTRRLGFWSPSAGRDFPAYFHHSGHAASARSALETIRYTVEGPFLFLSPATLPTDLQFSAWLKGKEAWLIRLGDTVDAASESKLALTSLGKERLRAFREAVGPDAEGAAFRYEFPTPHGARWTDLRLLFLDDHTLEARLDTISKVLDYRQMGFLDGRTKRPNRPWEMLTRFADGEGKYRRARRSEDRNESKRKEMLSKQLSQFFHLQGDPILSVAKGSQWETVFRVGRKP